MRDYLLTLDWDQTYPGPALPDEIVKKAAARYQEIYEILTPAAEQDPSWTLLSSRPVMDSYRPPATVKR